LCKTFKAIELDFQYPAEGIRERLKQGYHITSVAANLDEVAFIFSIPGGAATASVEQEMLQTSNFPNDSEIKVTSLALLPASIWLYNLCFTKALVLISAGEVGKELLYFFSLLRLNHCFGYPV